MAFAVVLFTLLAQATTISSLLQRLGFTAKTTTSLQYERMRGELLATRSAGRHLDSLYHEGVLLPFAWETVKGELDRREESLNAALRDLLDSQPEMREQILPLRGKRCCGPNVRH